MNNKSKDFFINDVDVNVDEEEIILAQPTELIEEANKIAQNTKSDEKFPFALQYNANQKEFLLSMIKTTGAIVEDDDEEGHTLATIMNMTQLAFIKQLDCVERVKTDEVTNPSLVDEAVDHTQIQQEDESIGGETQKAATNVNTSTIEVQAVALAEMDQGSEGVAVASVAASTRSSNYPTNVSMQTAATVSDESNTSGYICCPGFEQWFKFVARRTGLYTICTTGSLDTVGALYDGSGDLIIEVDDYDSGKINFRIVQNLVAGNTYYVKVRAYGNGTGSYILKVTEKAYANYVTISKSTINLEKGVTYELPITPNYTYKGYNGAKPIPGLSVSINPSNTEEQTIDWWAEYGDVLSCSYGHDDDYDAYIHVTAKEIGTAKLYAQDVRRDGRKDECSISVTNGWLECSEPTIYSRESWGARSVAADRLVERTRAPELLIFHHAAQKFSSTDIEKVKKEIRRIQNQHMDDIIPDNRKCDIAYHFIIDPAGRIWQGAEVDGYKRGHADGHFDDIGILLLGDFESRWMNAEKPNTLNDNQKEAMKLLSKWLCYKYELPFDRVNRIPPITTHRAASGGTECPGENVIPWVENDLKNYIADWHL